MYFGTQPTLSGRVGITWQETKAKIAEKTKVERKSLIFLIFFFKTVFIFILFIRNIHVFLEHVQEVQVIPNYNGSSCDTISSQAINQQGSLGISLTSTFGNKCNGGKNLGLIIGLSVGIPCGVGLIGILE